MSYEYLAARYDEFMEDTPYDKWCGYICETLRDFGITQGLALDLGCGTGKMTRLLQNCGYDMIGVDSSVEMLQIAMDTPSDGDKLPILYLNQDMREFELYGTVRAVVSICDCVNYILEREELVDVFKLVNNYLDPKGIFIFDFNTVYKYKEVIGNSTIAESREDCSFIWENYYDDDTNLNEYDLTLFIKEHDELFRRETETHVQRGYTFDEMKQIIEDAGLVLLNAVDADTYKDVTDESERIFITAMEKGK